MSAINWVVEETADLPAAQRALASGNLPRAEALCRIALDASPSDPVAAGLLEEIGHRLGLQDFRMGRDDPPGDRYLLIKPWASGLWSDVDHVLGQLLLAEITGRIPVTDWGSASLYALPDGQDAWRSLFQPISPLAVTDLLPLSMEPDSVFPPKWAGDRLSLPAINRFDGPWSRISGLLLLARPERIVVSDFHTSVLTLSYWIPANHRLHGKTTAELYRYLFDRYVRVAPEIAAEVERFRELHFAGRRVLAVHIRGTDKFTELPELQPVQSAAMGMTDVLMAAMNPDAIFLLTDEVEIVETFRSRFGARVVCTDPVRASGLLGVHFRNDLPRAGLGREVIVDTILAASAHVFVGNGASNVSAMVEHLRHWEPGALYLIPGSLHYRHNPFLYPEA